MTTTKEYEIVIGLEVHAQLLTQSKLFCGDSIKFGAEPNTHVSPITLAHPGTLPKMNQKAIEYAIKMGLVCHCEIENNNYFARKNYFYPDLPKGYQISQHTTPICKNGHVKITTAAGEKSIRLNRIHIEEDAGKSIHDADENYTCLDYNRAGTPLIEIVTEPDLRSAEEVVAYLTELRKTVRYIDVCDGNMEEGSLRCDVNISVRPMGETKLGTRVEVKNLNSIRNAKKAVEYESQRLIHLIESGEKIIQQTRSFDADSGTTFSIRDKEDAEDYRYFPDPDLTPFVLTDEFIQSIKSTLPQLQEERIGKYIDEWGLAEYDAKVITEDKLFADYFEKIATHSNNYKAAANCMLGPIKSWLNEHNEIIENFPLHPKTVADIISLISSGKISFSAAFHKLFQHLLQHPQDDVLQSAERLNLIQQSGTNQIEPIVDEVLEQLAAKVAEYKKGKKGLLALFVGEVMKRSKGKADPKVTNEIILKKLSQ